METNIENNKLIAEFMGLPKLTDTTWINPVLACSTDYLAYHESWGWLMPVIEKIEQYKFDTDVNDGPEYDTAYLRTFKYNMVRINRFSLHQQQTKILSTYYAVVEFILWHNETTTPKNK